MRLLVRAHHLLPDSDMIAGPCVEEATRLTVPAAPESLFAGLVSNTDCALDDPRATTLRLVLGPTNELLAQPLAFMVLAHGQVAYLALVPLDPLDLNASDDRLVAELEEVIVGVLEHFLGSVLNRKLIASIQ
jgi:hypothetical protein